MDQERERGTLKSNLILAIPIGIACGLASALFLALLELVTAVRLSHPSFLFLLPLGGLLVGGLYTSFGRKAQGDFKIDVERGNNLLLEEFHTPRAAVVPLRMAPLVLMGTLITHLFGGSAGREGTAVQMGGSLADQLGRAFKARREQRRALLMIGMSAGFGSVFGVPFAGALFGLEVFSIGKIEYRNGLECLAGAFIAHAVTLACGHFSLSIGEFVFGFHHTPYPQIGSSALSISNLASALVAGLAFGLTARLFVVVTELVKHTTTRLSPHLAARAVFGGTLISLLYFLSPALTRFAGLGVPVILDSFQTPLAATDWLGKLLMTSLTLGTGFKGGEVTPLLFVGATLGNALAPFLSLDLASLSAIGLVGVFAGAANTPLACTVMALELFGVSIGPYAVIACYAAYFASGHHGIYAAQKIHRRKNLKLNRSPGA